MKKIITVITFAVLSLLIRNEVSAQYGCPPYGAECPASSVIVVDKLIRDPRQKGDVYVDNLTLADYKFAPTEDIIFKIIVKNTGNKAIDNVEGIDLLPKLTDYLLLSGETRPMQEVTRVFGTLQPGETKEWYFRVRVKKAEELPSGVVCGDPKAINKITVRAKDMPDTSDTSSFCIEKRVLGAVTQPKAGAELYIAALAFMALTGMGYAGSKLAYHNR